MTYKRVRTSLEATTLGSLGKKGTQTKVVASMITMIVLGMLIIAGPANAYYMGTSLPTNVGDLKVDKGEELSFEVFFKITEEDQNLPIKEFELVINGPEGTQNCLFDVEGNKINGCEKIQNITLIKAPNNEQYGYGYGYGIYEKPWIGNGSWKQEQNFGYGYGYGYGDEGSNEFRYNITIDTTTYKKGNYKVTLKTTMGEENKTFEGQDGRFTIESNQTTLYVKEGFPQNTYDYVFQCEAPEWLNANQYSWNYDDGQFLQNITNNNTWHTYNNNGIYNVTCTASNNNTGESSSDDIIIQIGEEEKNVEIVIAEWYPQNTYDYVFHCNAYGYEPTMYDWYYDDGQFLQNITNNNTYHTFEQNGTYNVTCVAKNNDTIMNDTITVVVGEGDDNNPSVNLYVEEWYPKTYNQRQEYSFACEPEGFNATQYSWSYGNGQFLENVTNMKTFHKYYDEGQYLVECLGSNNNTGESAIDELWINVTLNGI